MRNEAEALLYQPGPEPKLALVQPVPVREAGNIIEFTQEKGDKNDEKFEQKISQWSKEWIDDFYNVDEKRHFQSFAGMDFSELLSEACDDLESYKKNRISREKSEAVGIFMDELIKFIENKTVNEKIDEKVAVFIENIQQYLFSFSPCIVNEMSLQDMFITAARASRVEAIQGWFAQNVNGELVYELSFSNPNITDEIIEKILNQDTANILDSINLIQTLMSNAFAQGEWAEPSISEFVRIIKEIEWEIETPLVRYALNLATERILQEYENPSLGVVTYRGNRQQGRLNQTIEEEDLEKHNKLSKKIIPSREVWFDEKLLPVSCDSIGIFDHSNILRSYSKLDLESLSSEAEVSCIEISNLMVLLGQNRFQYPNQRKSLIEFAIGRGLISEEDFENCIQDGEFFLSILTKKTEELREQIPQVFFENLNRLSIDEQVNPFAKDANEDEILLFQQLHVPEMRKAIEKDLGIELTEIPLRSQFYLLQYISDKEGLKFGQLKDCLEKNPNIKGDIAYAFLICAENSQYADAILEIANEYEENDLKGIFSKYREIAEGTRQIESLMQAQFKKEKEFSISQIQLTARTVLQKANEVLLDFSGRIKKGEVLDENNLKQKLESIKADQIFFTSVFKNFAKNNPEASFEDFKGLSFETMSSPEVKKYSERFFEIANENNQNENPIVQEIVRKGLEKGLENEKTVFDVLLKDEDPIALQRFDDEGTYYYYGSVNVDVKYHGSAIFEQMKKESLDRRAKEKPIKAHCNSANFVSSQYVENSGFVIDGTVLDGGVEEKDGRTIDNRLFTFAIERDDQKNGNYQYRQHVSTEQLKAMENQLREDLESGKESRKELLHNRKPFVISFEENQRPTFFKLAEKLTKEYGYVISRYFFEGKTGGKFFAGFEQKL